MNSKMKLNPTDSQTKTVGEHYEIGTVEQAIERRRENKPEEESP